MTGLPAGIKVELELTAGTWTDITSDVDAMQPISWHIGRTSPFSDPGAASFSITMQNDKGKYTPQRQVLADGVTAHPYWPNLDVRKRIRLSYTISAVQYVRIVGYVKQYLPQLANDGYQQQCVIVANDRLDQFSRVNLRGSFLHEVLQDNPEILYLMNEPAGATQCLDSAGISSPVRVPGPGAGSELGSTATLGAPNPIPVPDGLTGMSMVGVPPGGEYVTQTVLRPAPLTIGAFESWMTVIGGPTPLLAAWAYIRDLNASSPSSLLPGFVLGNGLTGATLYAQGEMDGTPPAGAYLTAPVDNLPHHLVMTQDGANWDFYFDGNLIRSMPCVAPVLTAPVLQLFSEQSGQAGSGVVFGPQIIYPAGLSAARVAAHYAAGVGNAGETTGARVARYLRYGGLSSTDWNVDTGIEVLSGLQSVTGKALGTACKEMVDTEGGGSVFYVAPDGRTRFADRTYRKPGAPTLTVNAGADLDAGTFAPSYDELILINQSTVAREGGTPQTYTDTVSANKYGTTTDSSSITSYASTDQAALNLAQWRVRSQSTPGLRLGQVAVDMLTATTTGLYQAVAAVQIGSRIRVTGLDPTASYRTQIDLIVEGWTETVAVDQYMIVFDTSPADNPARGLVGDPVYGRANPNLGAMTLQSAITAAATTVVVSTASGPTYTTDPAQFPQNIIIGQEVITLNTAPTGSSSPQTFNGVTRGAAFTTQAAQAAGSVVNLWPAATACL